MAENEQAARPSVERTDGSALLPITRDAGFVRVTADDIIVVHRRRDVQISLIVEGPEPFKQGIPTKGASGFAVQEVQLAHSFAEIARVGLPPDRAFSMAMNIIEAALESGDVPIKSFRERFLAMLDEHDKSGEDQQTEAPTPSRTQ